MTVSGFCVDPKLIDSYWTHAKQLIKTAIEHENLSDFESIENKVLAGEYLLWLGVDGGVEVAAVTQLGNAACTIVACSGRRMERWRHLLVLIENYARDEGCNCVRIYGRTGWQKALPEYKVEHIVMEKSLGR